ncbi:MAG: amidase domain-containing protein [Patescibacteria group bacterium]|nr:MAG: amidase domain-containing protein [Patescibacteria group bacterium]
MSRRCKEEIDVKKLSKEWCLVLFLVSAGCGAEDDPIPQALSEEDLVQDDDRATAGADRDAPDNPYPEDEVSRATAATFRYDRIKARDYAVRYAKNPNPRVAYCGLRDGTPADCTNFASQTLWAGGVPMDYTGSDDRGWWYRYGCIPTGSSKSWRQVNRLVSYLVAETGIAEFRRRARDLELGDLIFYRLPREENGYRCDENLFNHSTVVTGFNERGEPLVSYHSNEALNVPWNAKNGSRIALGEACAMGFVHIKN